MVGVWLIGCPCRPLPDDEEQGSPTSPADADEYGWPLSNADDGAGQLDVRVFEEEEAKKKRKAKKDGHEA